MIAISEKNFRSVYPLVKHHLGLAPIVDSGTWQSISTKDHPEMRTHEVRDLILSFPVYTEGLDYHRVQIGPNLPWADQHFELDRTGKSEEPLNPGETWQDWPYSNKANSFREIKLHLSGKDQFNHTYAERYWPKFAGITPNGKLGPSFSSQPRRGIRYYYGDLMDVVRLLVKTPGTRQAYLPVWFPEDTGAVHGGRTPCSLGYHFLMRDRRLHVWYDIRSCDFVRHFQDDVYLTVRLLLWVLDRCREIDTEWTKVSPGDFGMHVGSMHLFVNDHIKMFGEKR